MVKLPVRRWGSQKLAAGRGSALRDSFHVPAVSQSISFMAVTLGRVRPLLGALILAACATPGAATHDDAAVASRVEPPSAIRDGTAGAAGGRAGSRRAIIVSFDALSEQRALETIAAEAIPAFREMFAGAACTNGARPAFPSVTAPGHASIWTGAYGNVNGVAANSQPILPRPEHTLLEMESGYSSQALRAEPIWLSAVSEGLRVAGHHVTQAPHAPGYRGVAGPDWSLDSARAAAESLLAGEGVLVMNGYNVMLSPARVITEQEVRSREASGWRNLRLLGGSVKPLELAWAVGNDSLYALLHGGTSYDRMLLSAQRDVRAGVVAHAAPVERAPVAGRALARHFASGVELQTEHGPAFAAARLFEISPDGSRYTILIPEIRAVEGNQPSAIAAYLRDIGGWYGNGAHAALRSGQLGPTLHSGGDGTAELRYMESQELLTRQFMRGSEWLWQRGVSLLLDYFPLIDETDHEWLGFVNPAAAGYDPGVARAVQQLRERAWALADVRLAGLRSLVARDSNAVLAVSGDHGMRSYWRRLRINAVLRDAGLLSLDSTGAIDLSRTRALSPNGYYVMVNRDQWKGGTVPEAEAREVVDAAMRALLAIRDDSGRQVVLRTWRADSSGAAELGIGGPTGGDLYYDLAEGYTWDTDPRGSAIVPAPRVAAGHGFPSVADDMHTVFCLWGEAVRARRVPHARTTDVAPTVSEWLGIRPPAHATGRSLLRELQGGPR
jgi:hypothetical protein